MTDSELVVVRTFSDRIEADLAASALEAAGIESFVRADDAGGTQPGMTMGHPVEIIVRKEDAGTAREILNTTAKATTDAK